jgi:hypothetical protein
MSRFGPKALYGLREIIFPLAKPGLPGQLCAAVLGVDNELDQLFSILDLRHRNDNINLIIERCRTWTMRREISGSCCVAAMNSYIQTIASQLADLF